MVAYLCMFFLHNTKQSLRLVGSLRTSIVSFPRVLFASAGALVLSFKGCTVFRPTEAIAGDAKQAKQASARPKTVRKFGTNQIRKS